MSNDRLIEALWPETRPAKPLTSLRAYVSNLRAALRAAGFDPVALSTETGGYRLQLEQHELDSTRFEALLDQSADSGATLTDQATALDEALGLVRGDPLADMAYDDFAQVEIERLRELVLAAEERRAEVAVARGEAAAWLPRITALIAAHPFRERLRATHMRSLAMTGRHTDALRSYADHRRHLADELGLEPGPDLQSLEAQILALDPTVVRTPEEPEAASGEEPIGTTAPRADQTASERRLITVLTATVHEHVAGSDPEDLREAQLETSRRSTVTVERFGGHLDAMPGPNLVAYFGYPTAGDRPAERAVLAGIELAGDGRGVGVASSLALVETSGVGPTIVGEAVSTAQRLAAHAAAGSVSLDAQTAELTQASFEMVHDGADAYTALRARPRRETGGSVLDGALRGRDDEVRLIAGRVEEARGGDGQIVLISGDPGIGKTRLVEATLAALDGSVDIHRLHGSPFHGQVALHPIVQHLEACAHMAPTDAIDERRRAWQGFVSASPPSVRGPRELLGRWLIEGDDALTSLSPDPDARRAAILEAAHAHLTTTHDEPVVCVIEDAQWIDPTTNALLWSLAEATISAPLVLLVTHRGNTPVPVAGMANATSVHLGPIPRSASAELARTILGGRATDQLVDQIVERADGVPLFVEEIARATAGGARPDAPVPATLHDSLMQRLDRVPEARRTVQAAAAIGATIDTDLLAAVTEASADDMARDLQSLTEVGILFERPAPGTARYRFRHVLLRDIAHDSLPRSERADLHRRIAEVAEADRPDLVASDPARLAHHWAEAGEPSNAVGHLLRNAQTSLAIGALDETIATADWALRLVESLDPMSRRALESEVVELRLAQGVANTQREGPASAAARASYAAVLDPAVETTEPQHFRALWGTWYALSAGGGPHEMEPIADRLHDVAQRTGDPAMVLESHHVLWSTLLLLGRFDRAAEHAREAQDFYDEVRHHELTFAYGGHDPGVCMWSIGGLSRRLVGDSDGAADELARAIELADRLDHAYSRVEASFGPLVTALLNDDAEGLRSHAHALDVLVGTGAVPDATQGYIDGFVAAADLADGDLDAAIDRFSQAEAGWRALWGDYCFPLDTRFAEALALAGRPDDATARLDRIIDDRPKRATWWDAELHRVRGQLVAAHEQPARSVLDDLDIARRIAADQGAVALELRVLADILELRSAGGGDPEPARVRAGELLHRVPSTAREVQRLRDLFD